MPKLFFLQQVTERTCSRPKRTPNSSEKRQGFWGVWVVLGLASIGHVDLTCQHVQSDVWEACRGELLKLEVVITNPVDLYIYVYIIWGCLLQTCNNWVVVSNIFHVHPYLGKIPNLTNIFQRGWNHQPMYGGCYELNHAYVSPLRLKGSNSELQHHHSLWSSAPLSASPKGFCIYIYIFFFHYNIYFHIAIYCAQFVYTCLSNCRQYNLYNTLWFMCQLASAAQAANLLITSAENGDLRKVRLCDDVVP